MNYGTIYQHVLKNLQNREDAKAFISSWILLTVKDMVTAAKFPEAGRFEPIPCPELDDRTTFNTSSGVAVYDSSYWTDAAGMLFPVALRDMTTGRPIKARDIRWYSRSRGTVPGSPAYYIWYGGAIWLDPEPNVTHIIELFSRGNVDISTPVADDQEPPFEDLWHEAVILGATIRGCRSLGLPALSSYEAAYKKFIVEHSEQHAEEVSDVDTGFSVRM